MNSNAVRPDAAEPGVCLGWGRVRAPPVEAGPWVPCCYGAAASGPCAAVQGAGNGCMGEVGGSITLQPLTATSSQTVCCSSSKSSSSDRCMVFVLLGHSELEASPTGTGRGLGPRAQPKLHGIPHSDPCHLSWRPRGWWLHVSPRSGIPLYQDWSAPRPCRLLGLACTSTMPFPDIVTRLAFTPNPAHSHCGQDW